MKVSIFETFEMENSPLLYDKPRNWQSTILHYYVSPVPYFHSIRKAHLIAYFFLLKALLTYIAYIFRIYKNMHIFYLIQSYHLIIKNQHIFHFLKMIPYTYVLTKNTYVISILSPDCLYEFAGVSGGTPLQTYSLSAIEKILDVEIYM